MLQSLPGIVTLREAGLQISVPDFFGKLVPCTVIWARPIKENFFEMSLQDTDGGFRLWFIKGVDGVFTPIRCTSYVSEAELTRLQLADRLQMDRVTIKEQILNKWIEEVQ